MSTKKTVVTEKTFKSGQKVRALKTSGELTKGSTYTVDRYSAANDLNGEPRLKLNGLFGRFGQSSFELADAPALAAPVETKTAVAPELPSKYSKALAQIQTLLESGATGISVSRNSTNGAVRVTASIDMTFNA